MKTDAQIKELYKISKPNHNLIKVTFFETSKDAKENTRKTELIKEDLFKIFAKQPDNKFGILFDLRPMGGESTVSLGSSYIYRKLVKDPSVNKIAILGFATKQKNALSFFMRTIKILKPKNLEWFKHEEEAVSWLEMA